ncbi:protein kinase [Agromyces sp. G08B096]|uniref:non-specific serine/threonine protein kinase n=1 Tax=Agromyces sp. G08B096 TaxID=3156399 RepID=A0AAU7W8B8_9MICO
MTTAPDRPAVDDTLAGARLDDRYELAALIGRGGMANVYRARDTVLGREVAVKVFRAAGELDDPERRRSETALLASLTHPALVMLHDASRDALTGRDFLVMELVDGPNLREHLAAGPLGADDAAGMLVELAEALHVIHARGVVHRDVKPANVLLAPSALPNRPWRAKLADFGIARLVDDNRLTATGRLIGTPGYLSPEQVRGEGARAASDVYALGLLALEARTGEQAFPGPGIEAASARLVHDPHVPATLGPDWRALIVAMTARDPADRPTALEVAVQASTLIGAEPAGASGFDELTQRDLTSHPAQEPGPEPHSSEAAPEADEPTAATKLLTTPVSTSPESARVPSGAGRTRPAAHADSGSRDGRGPSGLARWLVPVVLIALLATAAFAFLPGLLGAGGSAQEPALTPLPVIPGELGVHLEQLDEAVTP